MSLASELFAEGETVHYDGTEGVFRLRADAPDPLRDYRDEARSEWSEVQKDFIESTGDADHGINREPEVAARHASYTRYFAKRGPLHGDVLDIGGGWGLYREWWDGDGVFVVHDPGIERFERGPQESHRRHFARAFERQMVFVEGYGEHLPYPDGRFDTVLAAASLDHCLDPHRVLEEARRCLRPGGTLVIMQHIEDIKSVAKESRTVRARIERVAKDPSRVLGYVRAKLKHDHHIQHFTKRSLEETLRRIGFVRVSVELVDLEVRLVAAEGIKPYDS